MSGATTTQGTGPGAAWNNKGPGNGRNMYVPSVNPHIVAAGTAVLSGGTATVTFPNALTGSETGYVVMLTPEAGNLAYVSAKTDSSGNFASFTITGNTTNHVMWMVVKAGFGLDV